MDEEQRVFVDLIEDVLRSTPGLRYQRYIVDPDEAVDGDTMYAAFIIETNGAHELHVMIELCRDGLRLRINDEVFLIPVESPRRIDKWIDARCRDVEKLLKDDLRIETETLFGQYLSSDLYAGTDDRWVEIAECDKGWGWIGLTAWLMPFGLSPMKSDETVYRDWFRVAD